MSDKPNNDGFGCGCTIGFALGALWLLASISFVKWVGWVFN